MSRIIDGIEDLTKSILMDDEIMTEKLVEQIKKALEINCHLTSCYALQVEEVQDIHGKTSHDSGWYFILSGTRCGVRFFLSNDMEICRKPNRNTVRVVEKYCLYNHGFGEDFWEKWICKMGGK